MKKSIKKTLPSLLLVVIVGLVCCGGCGGSYTPSPMPWTGTAPEDLTQAQWQDILKVSLEYHEHMDSYKMISMTSVSSNAVGGENPWERSMNTALSGFRKLSEGKTQINMELSVIFSGLGQENEEQTVTYGIYAPDEWIYVSMATAAMGSYWVKTRKSSELEEALKFDYAEKQLMLLDAPTGIEYLRTEENTGVEYYVLSITPSKDALAKWFGEQDTGFQNLDWQKVLDNPYEDFKVTCYVTKSTYLIMSVSLTMIIEFTPEQAGNTTYDYDSMKLTCNMNTALFDFHVIQLITLPMNAFDAREVPGDTFLP